MMPAAEEGVGVGVKLVSLTPENPARRLPFIHASYVLFDAETQAPIAVLDGAALTALRTAVSGLATRCLARADAGRLVSSGRASRRERTWTRCGPSDRSSTSRSCRGPRGPRSARSGGPPATSAPWSVGQGRGRGRISSARARLGRASDGSLLAAGCHVNAIGSYQPHTRGAGHRDDAPRTDRRGVQGRRAGRGRDLLIPIEEGAIGADTSSPISRRSPAAPRCVAPPRTSRCSKASGWPSRTSWSRRPSSAHPPEQHPPRTGRSAWCRRPGYRRSRLGMSPPWTSRSEGRRRADDRRRDRDRRGGRHGRDPDRPAADPARRDRRLDRAPRRDRPSPYGVERPDRSPLHGPD